MSRPLRVGRPFITLIRERRMPADQSFLKLEAGKCKYKPMVMLGGRRELIEKFTKNAANRYAQLKLVDPDFEEVRIVM